MNFFQSKETFDYPLTIAENLIHHNSMRHNCHLYDFDLDQKMDHKRLDNVMLFTKDTIKTECINIRHVIAVVSYGIEFSLSINLKFSFKKKLIFAK